MNKSQYDETMAYIDEFILIANNTESIDELREHSLALADITKLIIKTLELSEQIRQKEAEIHRITTEQVILREHISQTKKQIEQLDDREDQLLSELKEHTNEILNILGRLND